MRSNRRRTNRRSYRKRNTRRSYRKRNTRRSNRKKSLRRSNRIRKRTNRKKKLRGGMDAGGARVATGEIQDPIDATMVKMDDNTGQITSGLYKGQRVKITERSLPYVNAYVVGGTPGILVKLCRNTKGNSEEKPWFASFIYPVGTNDLKRYLEFITSSVNLN